ncbi:hypothetical protein GCM10020216_107890 [Nonomuraea helvata]
MPRWPYVSRTVRATVDLPDPELPRITIKTVFGEPVSTVRRYRVAAGIEGSALGSPSPGARKDPLA